MSYVDPYDQYDGSNSDAMVQTLAGILHTEIHKGLNITLFFSEGPFGSLEFYKPPGALLSLSGFRYPRRLFQTSGGTKPKDRISPKLLTLDS